MTTVAEVWQRVLFILNNVFRTSKCFWLNINCPKIVHVYIHYLDIFRLRSLWSSAVIFSWVFKYLWPAVVHCSYWANAMLPTYFLVQGNSGGPRSVPEKPFCVVEVALSNCKHRGEIVLISTTQGRSMLSKHLTETRQTSNGIWMHMERNLNLNHWNSLSDERAD